MFKDKLILSLFLFIAIGGCYRYPSPFTPLNKNVFYKKDHTESKQLFKADADKVYEASIKVVEKDGRRITAKSKNKHIVVISYPFSQSKNVYGGTMKISIEDTGEFSTVIMHAYEKSGIGGYTIMDLIMEDLKKSLGEDAFSGNPSQ